MRAAFAVVLFGLVGGIALATAVLSRAVERPTTVAAALGLDAPDATLDRRRAEAVAILIADCMRERGLAWTAVPEAEPHLPDADLEPVAWARRWGFGVSTLIGSRVPAVTANPDAAALEASDAPTRDSYRLALHGNGRSPGCQQTATEAVYGTRDRLLAPLRPALAALGARVAADPASKRAVAAWQACVDPITTGLARDRRTLPGDLLARFDARLRSLSGLRSIAGLAALQADERQVATVVAECEVAYAADAALAAAPHESAFVTEHRQILASVGAAIRAAEAALPTLAPARP